MRGRVGVLSLAARVLETARLPDAVIAATGLYTPPNALSNAELVETFNTYVARFNAANAKAIEAGEVAALTPSSVEFIEKASGIKSRFVVDKSGLVDPEVMRTTLHRWQPPAPQNAITWGTAMAAMCAARLGEPARAVDLLVGRYDTNPFRPNGYTVRRPEQTPMYMPANGGWLFAAAMMAAGWDGSPGHAPGFPKDRPRALSFPGTTRTESSCSPGRPTGFRAERARPRQTYPSRMSA